MCQKRLDKVENLLQIPWGVGEERERKQEQKKAVDCMIIHCQRKTGRDDIILWANPT